MLVEQVVRGRVINSAHLDTDKSLVPRAIFYILYLPKLAAEGLEVVEVEQVRPIRGRIYADTARI